MNGENFVNVCFVMVDFDKGNYVKFSKLGKIFCGEGGQNQIVIVISCFDGFYRSFLL